LVLIPLLGFSQDTLDLVTNPSFEGKPSYGTNYEIGDEPIFAESWFDCGMSNFPNETRPDIFSIENARHLKIGPRNGDTYLGMVARDNNSWEEVSHELGHSVIEGSCYRFSIDLAKTESYLRRSRLWNNTDRNYNYDNPVILKIWGGREYCEKLELLYRSPPIINKEWQSYEIVFQAKTDLEFITLQAYYIDENEPCNGNILLDNLSKLHVIDCNE